MIQILTEKKKEIADLCSRHGVSQLAVFGSAKRGDFDPVTSDLDFTVEFLPGLERHSDAYFGILFGLEDLFGRRVDLIERTAIENRYLLKIIDSEKEPLYEAA